MDLHSSYFDVVVVGTGVTESIVSAAAARQGHTVLHTDPRDYYGGKWATLSWNDWDSGNWAQIPTTINPTKLHRIGSLRRLNGVDEDLIWRNEIRDLESLWYNGDPLVRTEVKSLSRRFNIDIIPKVLMAREEVIELLIQSNVSRYLEFACINRLMTSLPPPDDHVIESIPLSRSDIFTTTSISLVEKRRLMKFLEFVLTSGDEGLGNLTFGELSRKFALGAKLSHLLQAAVRTMDDSLQMDEGNGADSFNLRFTENCRLFLQSINRYGNTTPFLWTLYGVSEICQSFCRLSAIYGGTFILKRGFQSVTEVEEDGQRILKVETDGVEVRTRHLVLCPEIKIQSTGWEIRKSPKCIQGITLVRAVLLVTGPRLKEDSSVQREGSRKLAIYRFGDMDVVELDETSLATPKNFRMLQVSLPHHEGYPSPREIVESRLRPYLIFPPIESGTEESGGNERMEDKPRVLHGSFFLADFYDDIRDEDTPHPQIFHAYAASTELKEHVDKGREIFCRMYPGEEFLPPAPQPQEVDMEMVGQEVEEPVGPTPSNHAINGL